MKPEQFDRILRTLGESSSRRLVLGGALAAAMFGLVASASARKEDQRKRKDRTKDKDKRKHHGKNSKQKNEGCQDNHSEQEILSFIAKAAKKYGQSKSAMERVARCESSLEPCALNRSGPYYGLFQFLKSTWKTTPYGNKNIYDPKAQALAAAWMWKQGRKNEWACQ